MTENWEEFNAEIPDKWSEFAVNLKSSFMTRLCEKDPVVDEEQAEGMAIAIIAMNIDSERQELSLVKEMIDHYFPLRMTGS